MSKIPEPKTENPHESTWDQHGDYQWTYFTEEVKQRIEFFLQERLSGKNIEVGGGWYLSYPKSTVVDLSSVCLKHNPAKEKLQFDLDTIGKGSKLPYKDNTFDSATLISVWQYLKHPKAVISELERVLKPGAEIYLINSQGSGLEKCIVGESKTNDIATFFQQQGYKTLIEPIPTIYGDTKEFQSVCVGMPDEDLFGRVPSRIKNQINRLEKNQEIFQDPSLFLSEYKTWELRNVSSKLGKLKFYPVTKQFQEQVKIMEEFSQEYHAQTGGIPLIFIEHGFDPQISMLTPRNHLSGMMYIMMPNKNYDKKNDYQKYAVPLETLREKYKLHIGSYFNYFDTKSVPELIADCSEFKLKKEDISNYERGNEGKLKKYASFIAATPLNSFTQQLQQQIYDKLRPRISDLDERILREKALGYYFATHQDKQQRRIDELIAIKKKIEQEHIPIIEVKQLDYIPFIPIIKQFIN